MYLKLGSCRLRSAATVSNWRRSCRRRSCDRSVAVRRQSVHVAGDPATDQLPFDARAFMSPAILRPTDRSQSQPLPIISRPLVADRISGRSEPTSDNHPGTLNLSAYFYLCIEIASDVLCVIYGAVFIGAYVTNIKRSYLQLA